MIDQVWLKNALAAIQQAQDETELGALRVKYLGRKSELAAALRQVGQLPAKARAEAGKQANQARQRLEQAISRRQDALRDQGLVRRAATGLDLTAPALGGPLGHLHPSTRLLREIITLFWQMGFEVAQGPEIETEWYNFEALNIPPEHPARDMQDTFYLEGGNLPRTHTSGVQIRHMEKHQPPIRIIAPGRVYRNEDEDPTHLWMFNQVEGLVVDEGISLAHLKGTLETMARGLLGEATQIQLRPSFFPYTEPSVEVDATCSVCGGKGCHTCAGTGWIELLGAGMVHPQLLRNVGLDPEKYSGFAFGVGVERLAAVKFGLTDLRLLWRPDLRFLEQF